MDQVDFKYLDGVEETSFIDTDFLRFQLASKNRRWAEF